MCTGFASARSFGCSINSSNTPKQKQSKKSKKKKKKKERKKERKDEVANKLLGLDFFF